MSKRGGRRRAVAALGAALVASCAARPDRGDTGIRPFAFDLWDVHCPSGLRVIFERAPGSRVAGVTTLVGAGGRHDPPGREGLAHLVEHLAFRSHGPEAAPMRMRLWEMGALYNADTWFEATTYHAIVPRENLRALLANEGERMLDPVAGIDEATFAVERDVVRNELREGHETGMMAEAFSDAWRAIFRPDHPYSRPVIGTHESLSALTLEDARRFARTNYRPEAMTMVVVGDMDLAGVEAFVRGVLPAALYGDPQHPRKIAAPPAPPKEIPPLPSAAPMQTWRASVTSPEIWMAWSLPGGYLAERYLGELWAWLSNGSFHWGRLDDTDVASVRFYSQSTQLASVLICRVRLSQGDHPEESLRQVIEALPWIGGDELFLDMRIQSVKLAMLRELSQDSEHVVDRSRLRADYAHFVGTTAAYGAAIDAIKAITADRAHDFAQRYLGRDRARAVRILPIADDARPATPIPPAQDVAAQTRHTPLPAATLGRLAGIHHLDGLRAVTLKNGLTVILLPRRGAPVMTATLAFHGGEIAGRTGIASAASEALELHFEEGPGSYGIQLGFSAGRDLSEATVQAGSANLSRALDMLSFAVRSYDLDWPSDKFRETKVPLLRRHDALPQTRNERAFWAALLHGHRYGESPDTDQILGVTKRELADWLERTVVPGNSALVIVGDLSIDEAEAAARDSFAGWGELSAPVAAPPPAAPPAAAIASAVLGGGGSTIITHRPGATQAEVHLGCLLPPAGARSDAIYDIVADLVTDALWGALREQTGSTYGVHVDARTLRGGTAYLRTDATVDNGRLPLVLATLRRYWRRATKNGEEQHAVDLSRDSLTSTRLLRYQSSQALARALVRNWNHGWPLAAIDEVPAYLASARADEVNATLRACARNLVLAISGDVPVIRAALVAPPAPGPEAQASPPGE